jgi:outer membrane protein
MQSSLQRLFLLVAALAAGPVLRAPAQTPAAPAPTPAAPAGPVKVAVIHFQDAVTHTNEFQRNFADLQKKYDPKRQQLKALGDEIDTLTKQLNTQGTTLSEAERATKARTLDDKKKEAQRLGEDAQNDFQQEMQQTFNATASKVEDVLVNYAEQQGYTLVLDGEAEQAPIVLYAVPSIDISKAILDAYNAKSGVPAPVSLPAAPAPTTGPKAPDVH